MIGILSPARYGYDSLFSGRAGGPVPLVAVRGRPSPGAHRLTLLAYPTSSSRLPVRGAERLGAGGQHPDVAVGLQPEDQLDLDGPQG